MAIYRYQTLSLTIDITPKALEDFTEVIVSVRQGQLVKHFLYSGGSVEVDAGNGALTINLSQEDTAQYRPGAPCAMQVNILTSTGERLVSDMTEIDNIFDNLYTAVIE